MKNFCMSSFLAFRFVEDEAVNFYPGLSHRVFKPRGETRPCRSAAELDEAMEETVRRELIPGRTGLFLSGGIDSAILAAYLPAGSPAYTFKCLAPGAIDETGPAADYARQWGLDHRIVEMNWGDFPALAPALLRHNQVPIHSIEVQLYKAALRAKADGLEKIIIGESADLIYGGMDRLLAKDWGFDEFIERYTFVKPEDVLREPVSMRPVYEKYRRGTGIDLLRFMDDIFSRESSSSYLHAFELAELDYLDPYARTRLAGPLDLARVRGGEPKYLVRDLFRLKYPGRPVPDKIPLPRPMNQWLADWPGPVRPEFRPGCAAGLNGDQKWLVWCLELFLKLFEPLE